MKHYFADFSLKDTAAYKVVNEIVTHTWSDIEWGERDLMSVYRLFVREGGSWEGIMKGDTKQFDFLEGVIDQYINYRDMVENSTDN